MRRGLSSDFDLRFVNRVSVVSRFRGRPGAAQFDFSNTDPSHTCQAPLRAARSIEPVQLLKPLKLLRRASSVLRTN